MKSARDGFRSVIKLTKCGAKTMLPSPIAGRPPPQTMWLEQMATLVVQLPPPPAEVVGAAAQDFLVPGGELGQANVVEGGGRWHLRSMLQKCGGGRRGACYKCSGESA